MGCVIHEYEYTIVVAINNNTNTHGIKIKEYQTSNAGFKAEAYQISAVTILR